MVLIVSGAASDSMYSTSEALGSLVLVLAHRRRCGSAPDFVKKYVNFGASVRAAQFIVLGSGKVRAIGVSNFQPDRIMDIIVNNRVVPAVNQVETHPFNQQTENQSFLKENGVQMESWAPFAEGKNNIFGNESLAGIAKAHDKSVAQVILRWLTQRGLVAIPKSTRRERMLENFDVFSFSLSPDEMQSIGTLDTKTSSFFDHRDPKMVKALSSRKLNI